MGRETLSRSLNPSMPSLGFHPFAHKDENLNGASRTNQKSSDQWWPPIPIERCSKGKGDAAMIMKIGGRMRR